MCMNKLQLALFGQMFALSHIESLYFYLLQSGAFKNIMEVNSSFQLFKDQGDMTIKCSTWGESSHKVEKLTKLELCSIEQKRKYHTHRYIYKFKKLTIPSVGEDMEKLEISHIAGRKIKYSNHFGKQFGSCCTCPSQLTIFCFYLCLSCHSISSIMAGLPILFLSGSPASSIVPNRTQVFH